MVNILLIKRKIIIMEIGSAPRVLAIIGSKGTSGLTAETNKAASEPSFASPTVEGCVAQIYENKHGVSPFDSFSAEAKSSSPPALSQ